MKSPCISVCVYDYEHNHCTGCFRNLEEIASWQRMEETKQREVLKRCKDRFKAQRKRNVYPTDE